MIDFLMRPPISWREVAKRTVREVRNDNCLGLAAQLAFYFLLALFPALLFLVALIGYLPVEDALSELLTALAAVAPNELILLLRAQLVELGNGSQAGLLALGILGAVWSSSAAMVAIIDALNRAYDVPEWRVWWKRRILAILLTVALAVFIIIALGLVVAGPAAVSHLAVWAGLESEVAVIWSFIRWPAILCCVVFVMNLVYHFAPNRRIRWAWITPGSCLATALWLICSFGFRWYVRRFGDYAATYGAIGGAVVSMLWFYVSSLAILIGAELNGVIEDARRSAPGRHT